MVVKAIATFELSESSLFQIYDPIIHKSLSLIPIYSHRLDINLVSVSLICMLEIKKKSLGVYFLQIQDQLTY